MIRFHLDENCPSVIGAALRKRGIDVSTTAESGLCSASDEEQLAYATRTGRVLVTFDYDFLRLHATGIQHCGIVYCAPLRRTIGEIIRTLVLVAELMHPDEMRQHLEFM